MQKEQDELVATLQHTGMDRDHQQRQREAAEDALAAVRRQLEAAKGEVEEAREEKLRLHAQVAALQGQVQWQEQQLQQRQLLQQQQQQQQPQPQQGRRESTASALSLGSARAPFASREAELEAELQVYKNMLRSQELGFSLVYVREVHHPKRYIVVANGTNLDVSLAGWSLQARSNPEEVSYEFPDAADLAACGSLHVWWGGEGEALQYKARPNRRNFYWEERCVSLCMCLVCRYVCGRGALPWKADARSLPPYHTHAHMYTLITQTPTPTAM